MTGGGTSPRARQLLQWMLIINDDVGADCGGGAQDGNPCRGSSTKQHSLVGDECELRLGVAPSQWIKLELPSYYCLGSDCCPLLSLCDTRYCRLDHLQRILLSSWRGNGRMSPSSSSSSSSRGGFCLDFMSHPDHSYKLVTCDQRYSIFNKWYFVCTDDIFAEVNRTENTSHDFPAKIIVSKLDSTLYFVFPGDDKRACCLKGHVVSLKGSAEISKRKGH